MLLFQIAPKLPDPYLSLATIFEEVNDINNALKVYHELAKFSRSYDLWCKVVDLSWNVKEYDVGLEASTRALVYKQTHQMKSRKILFLLCSGNVLTAESLLDIYVQSINPSSCDYCDKLEFLLEYSAHCCEVGHELLAIKSLMTLIIMIIEPNNGAGNDQEQRQQEVVEEEEEEVEEEENEDDGSDSDDENQDTDESAMPTHLDIVNILLAAVKKLFVLCLTEGFITRTCMSTSCHGSVNFVELDELSKPSTETSDQQLYVDTGIINELSGLLMLIYKFLQKDENNDDNRNDDDELDKINFDLSKLSFDMQILFCVCRIGIKDQQDDITDNDDENRLLKASRKFLNKLSISRSVTCLMNSFAHMYKEESIISQALKRTDMAENFFLRKHCIKYYDDYEEQNLDLARFTLDDWHFLMISRCYAAESLFHILGMVKEAQKVIDKLISCPLIACERRKQGPREFLNEKLMKRIFLVQIDFLSSSKPLTSENWNYIIDVYQEAVAVCEKKNITEILLSLTFILQHKYTCDESNKVEFDSHLHQMFNLLNDHVMGTMTSFDEKRKEYVVESFEFGNTHSKKDQSVPLPCR